MSHRSWSRAFGSSHFIFAIVVATVAMTGLALALRNTGSSLAAAILGLYLLHLLSVRFILEAQRKQQQTLAEQFEQLHQLLEAGHSLAAEIGGDAPAPPARRASASPPAPARTERALDALLVKAARVAGTPELPLPRHFALGTVAIVRRALQPADVARILVEQGRRPGVRFGDVALELGLLTRRQVRELVEAQQQGMFTDAEIREARDRIERFRRNPAVSAA